MPLVIFVRIPSLQLGATSQPPTTEATLNDPARLPPLWQRAQTDTPDKLTLGLPAIRTCDMCELQEREGWELGLGLGLGLTSDIAFRAQAIPPLASLQERPMTNHICHPGARWAGLEGGGWRGSRCMGGRRTQA